MAPLAPIPVLFIFSADHLLNFAFIQGLTPSACFNWWGCSVVVLNSRQMVLKQGPHTETCITGAGRADPVWILVVGAGALLARQRGCAGCKGQHHPSSSPISSFYCVRVCQAWLHHFHGVPVTEKALLAGRRVWEGPHRAMAAVVPSPCRQRRDGARQRLSNEAMQCLVIKHCGWT